MSLFFGLIANVFGTEKCHATYSVDGSLHIPYVDAPGPFDSIQVYEVDMKLVPQTSPFQFTLTGAVPIVATEPSDDSKSCWEIKENAPSSEDGIYKVDPDSEGGNESFDVYCDMTTDDGGWTLVFRHNAIDGYFSSSGEVLNVNQENPSLSTQKYSILNKLDYFKRDNKFQFRLTWPEFTKRNIWLQYSNPTDDVNVSGYQAISVDSTSNYWGGLELGNGSHGSTNNDSTYLDGSVNHGNWFYAVGSYKAWGDTSGCFNSIPASDTVAGFSCGVQEVELWVR